MNNQDEIYDVQALKRARSSVMTRDIRDATWCMSFGAVSLFMAMELIILIFIPRVQHSILLDTFLTASALIFVMIAGYAAVRSLACIFSYIKLYYENTVDEVEKESNRLQQFEDMKLNETEPSR